MRTTPGFPHLLSRVFARAVLGVWRHRVGVLLAAVISVALGSYAVLTSYGVVPTGFAGVAPSTTDCADTAIAAMTDKSARAAQKAYACMDASFQQRVPEATFVQQMQSQQTPSSVKVERVGDYHTSEGGGTLVYFALDGGNQSVGYIVYLGSNGKILRIE